MVEGRLPGGNAFVLVAAPRPGLGAKPTGGGRALVVSAPGRASLSTFATGGGRGASADVPDREPEEVRKQKSRDYRGYRRAGIRLTEELLPDLAGTEASTMTLYAVHRFDKAHLVMMAEEELIPRPDAVAMLRVLRELEDGDIVTTRLEAGGGTHSGEQILIRRLGEEVGGKIHLGRSSGDLVAVSSRMYWRDQLLEMVAGIDALRAALVDLAEHHLETVMPAYTHLQPAQPTTYGHHLLAWCLALSRDVERARAAYSRVNVSPAGAAILSGSSFTLNRSRTAELLGFDRPSANTIDPILQHDDALEIASVLAIHTHTMARIADDLIFWSAPEVGMVSVPDRFCGTSSIMMQKKNPYAPEHIKGTYGDAVGGLVTGFLVEKGSTGAPILDRTYSEAAIQRQFPHAVRNLGWMVELVPQLVVRKDVMLQRAGAFWAQGTDVAGALVRELGMNWRSAHQIVGILVRYTEERGLSPQEVTPELLNEAAVEYMGTPVELSEPALREALDCMNFVRTRTLYGGPAPETVREQLPEYRESLRDDDEWLAERRQSQRNAEQALESAIDGLIADRVDGKKEEA